MNDNPITLKIKKVEQGLEIFIECELLENYFKFESKNETIGYSRYTLYNNSLTDFSNYWYDSLFSDFKTNLNSSSSSSMMFLRSVNIGQGKTFLINGVFTEIEIINYYNEIVKCIRYVYNMHIVGRIDKIKQNSKKRRIRVEL